MIVDIWDEPLEVEHVELKKLPGRDDAAGPLPVDAVRESLWRCKGNIGHVAKALGVPFALVWQTIKDNPELEGDVEGAREQLVSIAEEAVYEALNDYDDIKRKDAMAKFVIGRKDRQAASKLSSVNVSTPGGTISVVWGNGQPVAEGGADE